MRKWPTIGLLFLGATLGVTVFSGPIATAAQSVRATIVGPLDGGGNVKVHEQGTANVNVVGNASVQAGIPATQFSATASTGGPVAVLSGPDLAGTNYAITSVSFSARGDAPQDTTLLAEYGATSDCRTFSEFPNFADGPHVSVPAHDTVGLTFPQPFVLKARSGGNSCLTASPSGLSTLLVTIVGYRF
jgi:hypothetical protein